jgi:hypothetical protein
MRNNIATFCRTSIKKLAVSLKRFPEAVLLCAIAASVLMFSVHAQAQNGMEDKLIRVCLIFALGVPVVLCIKLLLERIPHLTKGARVFLYMIAAIGLTLYFLFYLHDLKTATMIRYIAFSIAFYLTFSFIPYFYKRENYELYVITLLSRFFVTYIYSMVLYAGLAAILFTIDRLFSIKVSHKFYLDCLIIVGGIFAPAFFLADIPQIGEDMKPENYSKVLKVLILYIVMPILVIYTIILYAFFAKILITLEWPTGIVAHLVLWYSIVSALVIFLIYPLRKTNPWVRKFIFYLPRFIIPLLGMMFVSMGIRLKAYGITENRYLVMVVGIWVTGCMIYHIFSKKTRNIALPVSLAIIAVLAVVGPWSCFSVSKASQNNRFESILRKYDMIQANTISKSSKEVTDGDKKEISAILLYFNTNHSLAEVRYLPEDFDLNQMEKTFGFKLYRAMPANHFSYWLEERSQFVNINEYDYFIHIFDRVQKEAQDKTGIQISYEPSTMQLEISKDGVEIYNKSINEIAYSIHIKNRNKETVDLSDMTFYDKGDKIEVMYVFLNISGKEDDFSGKVSIDWVDFYVFLRCGS